MAADVDEDDEWAGRAPVPVRSLHDVQATVSEGPLHVTVTALGAELQPSAASAHQSGFVLTHTDTTAIAPVPEDPGGTALSNEFCSMSFEELRWQSMLSAMRQAAAAALQANGLPTIVAAIAQSYMEPLIVPAVATA